MGKISPVSSKYIVHARILIEGVVDRPDVVGAIFGQTEGLLGSDLELRELQRSGRIGRIEVNVHTTNGKTSGEITIPSSLDKAETAIVGAALEIIQRIGPCTAKIDVDAIEDVRISKRRFVIERAKQLLKQLTESTLPDSQELADEVAESVRVMEITEFGREKLPAGPNVKDSDEVTVVEGRADVINLLKHGIKNAVAINGTCVPQTIKELSKEKVITAFVDGDRGGDLIIKELLGVADIDFVCKAPDGKEVEELTKKEIHKSLRSRIASEQTKLDLRENKGNAHGHTTQRHHTPNKRFEKRRPRPQRPEPVQSRKREPTVDEKKKFKQVIDDLVGTRGAVIFDNKLSVLGKVPVSELGATVKSLGTEVYALALDGPVDREMLSNFEHANVQFVASTEVKDKKPESKVTIFGEAEL